MKTPCSRPQPLPFSIPTPSTQPSPSGPQVSLLLLLLCTVETPPVPTGGGAVPLDPSISAVSKMHSRWFLSRVGGLGHREGTLTSGTMTGHRDLVPRGQGCYISNRNQDNLFPSQMPIIPLKIIRVLLSESRSKSQTPGHSHLGEAQLIFSQVFLRSKRVSPTGTII